MSIGLDFVMNKDKNWKKHIKSLDRIDDDLKNNNSIKFKQFENKSIKQNIENKNIDFDYWNYWKKKYFIF